MNAINSVLGEQVAPPTATAPAVVVARRKGKMSAAGRARISAAQSARWAKLKATANGASPKAAPGKKRKMSPAAKARLSALAKARWAKAKTAGKTKL